MTRRKRSASPDPQSACKRVALVGGSSSGSGSGSDRNTHLPVPQSLATQNGVVNHEQEDLAHGHAYALSQPPSHGGALAAIAMPSPPPPSSSSLSSSARDIRFKYDPRQFPLQQEWPQPSLNPGAIGHARFLEKKWQSAQATSLAERVPSAQYMRQQLGGGGGDNSNSNSHSIDGEHGGEDGDGDRDGEGEDEDDEDYAEDDDPVAPSLHTAPKSPPQLESTPRKAGAQRQRLEPGIEQRRQAIISKLMASNPASIATPSSNIQIPTGSGSRAARVRPSPSPSSVDRDGDGDSQIGDLATQAEQLAALMARKRAENAANGSLNRWLLARQKHQQAQQGRAQRQSSSASSVSSASPDQDQDNSSVFQNPNLTGSATDQTGVSSAYDMPANLATASQDLDLAPLFSSPAPSHNNTNAGRASQIEEVSPTVNKISTTQLPSPSNSSPSPSEIRWAPSSAQLLINLAQAAPAPPLPSQAQHSFRTPSMTISTDGRARTSSTPLHGPSRSQSSLSVDGSGPAQQHQDLNLMQQQQLQNDQHQRQELDIQHYQQMAQAAQARYAEQQSLTHLATSHGLPSSPSTNMVSNNMAYYQIKPSMWGAFDAGKFPMTTSAFMDNATTASGGGGGGGGGSSSNNSNGASAAKFSVGVVGNDYAMAGMDGLQPDSTMYPESQTSIYSATFDGVGGQGAGTPHASHASHAPHAPHFVMTDPSNSSNVRHQQQQQQQQQQHTPFGMPDR